MVCVIVCDCVCLLYRGGEKKGRGVVEFTVYNTWMANPKFFTHFPGYNYREREREICGGCVALFTVKSDGDALQPRCEGLKVFWLGGREIEVDSIGRGI